MSWRRKPAPALTYRNGLKKSVLTNKKKKKEMKRIMLFLMLMLGTVSAVMAQGVDVPVTDYDAMIGTFAGFAAGVVVLTDKTS